MANGATNRVEIYSELEIDPDGLSGYTVEAIAANYSARNTAQEQGGVNGFFYVTLATGMLIRVRAQRTGSTANKIIAGTQISIETKS